MSGSGEPSLALGQTRSPTILAVILGAQKWPTMSSLRASNSFALSAKAFKDYLKDETGLNLPQSCIKDLFDGELGRDATDLEIRNFLEEHYVEGVPNFTDVIIYYTGHGDFTKGEQHFQLILRTSNDKITDYAGYTMRQLAATVNSAARRARKLVILDCCYAAAAFNDWQKQGVDDVKRAISLQAATNFPDTSEITGTALLCACPEDKWALFKDDKPTMFSGGLVQSLLGGDDERGDFLSIGDVYELTKKAIANLHNSEAVAPLLHVPKGQREQMTSYALFPNGTRRVGPLGRRLSLIETAMSELRKQASAHTAILDEMRSSLSEITVRLRNDSEDLSDGLDLTRVKEGEGAFWTTVGNCEIRVVEGRLEDYAHATEGAIVLPCNEYFDDECVSDPKSALGAYIGRVFQGQLEALCSLVKEECRKKFGEGVERQKTEEKRAESFGAGRCLMLMKPLGRSPPIALVSTTIQRVGQGLLGRISYLFDGMHELVKRVADARLSEVTMPVLGAGHGGIDPPLALVGLLSAVAEAARYGEGRQHLKRVTIVVFRRDANSAPSVSHVVIRRALALIGSSTSE